MLNLESDLAALLSKHAANARGAALLSLAGVLLGRHRALSEAAQLVCGKQSESETP